MKGKIVLVAGSVAAGAALVAWWRRHPRVGTETMNRVVNPWLVGQGVTESSGGEIALLEHVGRVSGIVRLSPVHPVDTPDGVRIIVPLGAASEWARNVLAAGRCRLQRDEMILEFDSPRLVDPKTVEGLSWASARVMSWLGFRYLLLRRFGQHPGSSDAVAADTSGPEVPVAAAPVG